MASLSHSSDSSTQIHTTPSLGDEEKSVPDGISRSEQDLEATEGPTGATSDLAVSQPVDEGVTGIALLAIMVGITLTNFLVLLDTAILATAVPRITTDFHSTDNIGWYGAAYQLTSAVLQPLTGKLYANLNTKWTFIGFFVVFELGSLLCGVAVSSTMLVVGRAVAGIGTAGVQNGAYTIVANCVPMHRRPALIGIAQGVAQFGLVIGPLVGGALTDSSATWRWCFYLNLPCGAVVGALLFFVRIPEPVAKPKPLEVLKDLHNKVDLPGFVLFAPACIMLLLAAQWGGNTYDWNSATIIGLFVGSGILALIWSGWNWYKKDAAMIPLSVVRRRHVWTGCVTYGLLMSTMFCTAYYLPEYFQAVRGASATLSGVYMLPSIVAQLLGAVISGRLVGKLGYYLPFSLFSAVLMSVGYGLITTFSPHTSTGKWIGYQILFGFGRGCGLQMPIVAVQNTLPPRMIPSAIALVVFASTFSGALFLSFADTIFTNSLASQIHKNLPSTNAEAIIDAGVTGSRAIVSATDLPALLISYNESIIRIFYMCTAMAVVCFFTSWGLGWKDIRRKSPPAPNTKA
jgi:EmrB/QacA subfamily drug resistance transporter